MILSSITISNFRQFFGEVVINFSQEKNKNVTVIHGANGSGKTSLLNAFKWCFYDETDFDTGNEKILNEAAIQEKSDGELLDIKIAIRFKHEDRYYEAVRKQEYQKTSGILAKKIGKSQFHLDVRTVDGETIRSKTPSVEISNILPENLQPYFFFNGERIEKLAGVKQGVQIREAIRKLMGLELVDRAIVHVDKVKTKYRNLKKGEVSEDHKLLLEQIQGLEEDKENYRLAMDNAKKEVESFGVERKAAERELQQFEKSRELQAEREGLEELIEERQVEIKEAINKQKRLIDESAYISMSADLVKKSKTLIDEKRKIGILPYGIKEQFIDDRINLKSCICGTEIIEGSVQYKKLMEVRENAGSDEIESIYTNVSALLNSYESTSTQFIRDYEDETARLSRLNEQKEGYINEIDEINSKITSLDDNEILRLENIRKDRKEKEDLAQQELGVAKSNFDETAKLLKEKGELEERLGDEKLKQNIANVRMNSSEKISNTLVTLRDFLTDKVRKDLSKRVDNTFQSIIRKPVKAIIDEDFMLQVKKTTAEGEEYIVSEQSTGERQVTSLSFISSIIYLARDQHEKESTFFKGGLFPLVMDSPFGALDDDYREKVASSVSELAEQVIIFVSNSQWSGKVKQACENKVGKSYKLVYHAPQDMEVKESSYVQRSKNGFEFSTLEEV
ncbi:AAA family ATPase [Thalassomonas sp. M1454]|uniref:AAA family ATPase n=1 Tax=Thalassomonas sp. M1454 TaxID=2594477 RepID=UPI00163DC723|nr:AAA family ATPase [Thalassomonas sp. M1454]